MRAVIIGAGRMGRRHVQVAREAGLEIVGICDHSHEALSLAEQEEGVPSNRLFTDVLTSLSRTRPECVIVATTAPTHAEFTCMAAELGAKYILCEKPMATSLSDCDRMLAACRTHGTRLAINHQMRFMDQYTEPKRLSGSDELGGLSGVTVLAGNFGLAMNGTHYFEMFRYMTAEPLVEVTAWFSTETVPNPRGPEFEDRAGSVRVVTASGKRLYLDASHDQGHGVQVTYTGRNGMITVDELAGKLRLVARQAEHRHLPTTRYGMPWSEEIREIPPADVIKPSAAVLRALIAGNNYPSGEDGRLAVATLVAAHISDEHGHIAVHLADDSLPRDRCFPWA